MYPAMRDAKAAVRWVRANAEQYNAAPEYITAVGGSAGACSVVGLATTTESDYKWDAMQAAMSGITGSSARGVARYPEVLKLLQAV